MNKEQSTGDKSVFIDKAEDLEQGRKKCRDKRQESLEKLRKIRPEKVEKIKK